MTRAEAIAIIESAIPSADEVTLAAAARLLQNAVETDDALPRPLTDAELASIEQAREDFAAGRTYSSEEVRSYFATQRAQRRGEHSKV